MSYSLEKATTLLVSELTAPPASSRSQPAFQNLLLAPAGQARDAFLASIAAEAQVTIKSVDLPSAPCTQMHNANDIKTFTQRLRTTAESLQAEGGGLLVINDLGQTSHVLQTIAITSLCAQALKKAGLSDVHVLWTADPDDALPHPVANRVVTMSLDLSAAQAQRMIAREAHEPVQHQRLPDLQALVGRIPTPPVEHPRTSSIKTSYA